MHLVCSLLTVLLFAAFVPGVLFRLPLANKYMLLVAHGVLFVIANHLVKKMYMKEHMGNYGESCPNGYEFVGDDCVAVGHKTY